MIECEMVPKDYKKWVEEDDYKLLKKGELSWRDFPIQHATQK